MYGAASVVVAFLALPHFGAQIALFGAVFARVYAERGTAPPAAMVPATDARVCPIARARPRPPAQPRIDGPPAQSRQAGTHPISSHRP